MREDAGLSGTDDKRPELQRLLDMAASDGAPFDVVVVHSFSRFARDHFAFEYHVRRLRKAGVRLVSMTQDVGDDPMSVMVRQVFALFDEYQLKENAKHVLRGMQKNARQGFWNGSAAPFGSSQPNSAARRSKRSSPSIQRVAELLRVLMNRQTKRDDDLASRLTALRGKLTEAEGRLFRLYQAIETGIADPNDVTLKDRVAAVKTEREIAQTAFDLAVAEMRPEARITEDKIASFVATMRDNVLSDETAFRRAWLRSVIDKVEVDDTEIRIHGRRTVLERLVMGEGQRRQRCPVLFVSGAPNTIRTCGLYLRRAGGRGVSN